jgi:hypothetical protein
MLTPIMYVLLYGDIGDILVFSTISEQGSENLAK